MDNEICNICKAEFRGGYLEEGVCKQCNKLWPGAKSPEDTKKKSVEDKENEGNLKNRIVREVNEVLKDYGILKTCVCGESYFKRSPAQKGCGKCNLVETKS